MVIESHPSGGKRILIVEDDPSLRCMLDQFFRSLGFEVFQEDNGVSGLEKTFALRPDIILTDLNLPGMPGIEMCEKIKADPRVKDIPLLMMTGDLKTMESKMQGFRAHADDYLLKPLDISVLAARVQSILKGASRHP